MDDIKNAKLALIMSHIEEAEKEKYTLAVLLIQSDVSNDVKERNEYALQVSAKSIEIDQRLVQLQEQYKVVELE